MRYKSKYLIFDYITGYMFLSASEYAEYLGVSKEAIYKAMEGNFRCFICKGHKFEITNFIKGPFYYSNSFEVFRSNYFRERFREQRRGKSRAKPCRIYDLDDDLIFESESEYAEYLGVSKWAVSKAAMERRTCVGHHFEVVDIDIFDDF